ncbi:hypothetical protein QNA23_10865 [Rhodococcus erythropolis]|uniref:hypothetical protein n=1 Tax=Rhodococcus erythropolis TaxID=1833 RepID=UPI0024BB4F9F|nr:hypothetical protein [Rhodococcus erythropolis]MDJ0403984.1 hypothetical protein [Rhodococcus erythropolis]
MITWMADALISMLVVIGFLVTTMGLVIVTTCGTYITVTVVRAAFTRTKGAPAP